MKKIILTICISFFSAISIAQIKDWHFEEITKVYPSKDTKVIGVTDSELFVYTELYSKISLSVFSLESMVLKKFFELDQMRSNGELFQQKDNSFVGFFTKRLKTGKIVMEKYKIDSQDGTIKLEVSDEFPSYCTGVKKHKISPNGKSHLLLFSTESEGTKMFIVNDQLEIKIEKSIDIDDENYFIEIGDDGSVYFFKDNFMRTYNALYEYEVWEETIDYSEFDATNISGGIVRDFETTFDQEGNLYIIGKYLKNTVNVPEELREALREEMFTTYSHFVTMKIDGITKELIYYNLEKVPDFGNFVKRSGSKKKIFHHDGNLIYVENHPSGKYPTAYYSIDVCKFDSSGKLINSHLILKTMAKLGETMAGPYLPDFGGMQVFLDEGHLKVLTNNHHLNKNIYQKALDRVELRSTLQDSLCPTSEDKRYGELTNEEKNKLKEIDKMVDVQIPDPDMQLKTVKDMSAFLVDISLNDWQISEHEFYSPEDGKSNKLWYTPHANGELINNEVILFFKGKSGVIYLEKLSLDEIPN